MQTGRCYVTSTKRGPRTLSWQFGRTSWNEGLMVFYLKYALVGILALGMTYYGWSPPGWQQWCVFSAYALFFALSLAIIDEVVRVIKVRGMTEIRGVTEMQCPLCLGKGYLEVGLPASLASTSEDFGICGHRDSATGPPRKTS